MLQSSLFDGVAFDPFAFQQDGLASAEVDVGRCQVVWRPFRRQSARAMFRQFGPAGPLIPSTVKAEARIPI
jgi:hypothetical protein